MDIRRQDRDTNSDVLINTAMDSIEIDGLLLGIFFG